MHRRVIPVLALVTGLLMGPSAHGGEPFPLFADNTTLSLTLEMPMTALRQGQALPEPLAGAIHYRANATDHSLSVEVSTRGHSRLEMCELPPLKLNFSREELPGTLFAGQNKLKLVTHCQEEKKFYRYLQHEYALYRSYSALTEAAFRVRRLQITYRDSEGLRKDKIRPAFLIESDDEVAARLGYEEVELPEVPAADLDPDALTILGLFQYLAGNTDWSLRKGRGGESCCHNGLLLKKPAGDLIIVPYDFDQAGVVNANYALPARGLGIRSVRRRLFRGLCTGEERLTRGIEWMNARRPDIEAEFPKEGSMKNSNRRALSYINDFYKTVNDPQARDKEIATVCRGNPDIWESD